jgi:O-antigen/teichoic acid export membrane protein
MIPRIGLEFVAYAGAKAGVTLSMLLVVRILSARLSPEDYGAYGLLASMTMLVVVATGTFLANAILRFLPRALEQRRLRAFIYVATQIGQLAAGIALVLLTIITIVMVQTGAVKASAAAGVAVVAAGFLQFVQFIYVAALNAAADRRRYSLAVLAQTGASLALLAWFAGSGDDVLAVLFACIAASHVALALTARPRLTFVRRIAPATWARLGDFAAYGLPMVLLHVSIQLNSLQDQFILRAFHGIGSVGLYAANYVLAEKLIYGFASIASLVMVPRVFRKWERGERQGCYVDIWRFFFLMVVVGVTGCAVLITFGNDIAPYVVGRDFLAGAVIIPYVAAGAVFLVGSAMLAEVFTLHQRTMELALCYVSATIFNLIANLALVPGMGIMGAAYATLATYIYLIGVVAWRAHRMSGLFRSLPAAVGVRT